MKLRISIWRISWRYLIVTLVVLALMAGVGISMFIGVDQETGQMVFMPITATHIIVFALVGVLLIGGYVISITSFYYIVEDKYFIIKRLTKEYVYEYKNVEFIDVEESKRKNMVIFYSKNSKTRYLLGDKDGVLLDTLLKKCPEPMSVEEFRKKHPEERY